MINEIATWFWKLTSKILANIEKYVIYSRLDSILIYSLIKQDYFIQSLNKYDLYIAVYNFYQNNNPENLDTSLIFQILLG